MRFGDPGNERSGMVDRQGRIRDLSGVGMGQKPEPVYLHPGRTMRLGIAGLGEQRQRTVQARIEEAL